MHCHNLNTVETVLTPCYLTLPETTKNGGGRPGLSIILYYSVPAVYGTPSLIGMIGHDSVKLHSISTISGSNQVLI